jgi:hypothetical protein
MADPDHVREQYAQAERLVREAQQAAEAAASAAGESEVPPRGWSTHGAEPTSAPFPDLGALAALVESMRGVVPPELSRQLSDALRDLLIALRAVLDFYIARLERPEPPPSDVQDIPVE